MIEVVLLRYALAAADSGSFSRAADQFRVKQSTLSKRVRHLELRLGVPLFTRTTKGVAPTPSGERFLARARAIVGDLDLLSRESLALACGAAGRLRVGFHGSLAGGELRALFEAFRLDAPDVEFDATEGGRTRLLDTLDRGHLDLAIVAGDAPDPCRRSVCLWSEPLSIAVPAGHALLERDRLYWTDLKGLRFQVTRDDPGSLIAAMVAGRLSGPGHAPTILVQRVSRDNLPSLATPDCLPVTAGAGSGTDPAICHREVHDAFGATRLDYGLHWRGENDNPALARFLRLVSKRFGRALPS
jgi:DNA-binding transcriptional LysR family regulator